MILIIFQLANLPVILFNGSKNNWCTWKNSKSEDSNLLWIFPWLKSWIINWKRSRNWTSTVYLFSLLVFFLWQDYIMAIRQVQTHSDKRCIKRQDITFPISSCRYISHTSHTHKTRQNGMFPKMKSNKSRSETGYNIFLFLP